MKYKYKYKHKYKHKHSILVALVVPLLLLSTQSALSIESAAISTTRMLLSAVITVFIRFDINPADIEWNITDITDIYTSGVAIARGGDYGQEFAMADYTEQVSVTAGSTYQFHIQDIFGDGLLNPGLYAIFLGTNTSNIDDLLIFSDNFTGTQDSVLFTINPPPTPTPTSSPHPTISPQPTHAPSSCVVGGLSFLQETTFNPKPEIKNAEHVFSDTNAFCTTHTNYIDCTNESREDCQWIFLPSSISTGKCRIDPISKCLQLEQCVCYTEDFHGGKGDYAGGILFHAPLSITPRDISSYSNHVTSYQENYSTALGQNGAHPHDFNFFVSKVDMTARTFTYTFNANSPLNNADIGSSHTIAFKLHYLYTDTPLVGTVLTGLGILITIDTSGEDHIISINNRPYTLATPLKKWTCTAVAITSTALYVAGTAHVRTLEEETSLSPTFADLILGPFPGELFDVRIYAGTLSEPELSEVGARCITDPDDPAALKVTRDIDYFYDRNGCDSRIPYYVTEPTKGGQSYGSGPFATLWLSPKQDPFVDNIFTDVSEGALDEEYYFQHKKIQTYLWEKYYFENDMIAFPLEPYRNFQNASQVPEYAASTWNNPCRYMHQNNNLWDFPLYGIDIIAKWVPVQDGEIFDLRDIFFKHGDSGYQYVAHETFHEFQQTLFLTYASYSGWWLSESMASFGPASTFPASNVLYNALPLAISYPMGYEVNTEVFDDANAHFLTEELSISDAIRVGHLYNSWVLWWFLTEHAGMPQILGQINSNERYTSGGRNGILNMVRLYVEAEKMDLGDVWGVFVAHYRTWDFKRGHEWAVAEASDFESVKMFSDPPLPTTMTLENRKTTVTIDSTFGTNGEWLPGPSALRPGPFGWNCLTMDSVALNQFVVIDITWDDGMGFQPNTNPSFLPDQQKGCDDDPRFYNSMVVAHNLSTGERRYWKLKGKSPDTLVIDTNDQESVAIYILLVPTPPSDYVGGLHFRTNTKMFPIPIYNYQYKVSIQTTVPSGLVLAESEAMINGIVNFVPAAQDYWPVRCTCMDDPSTDLEVCIDPTFLATTTANPIPPVTIAPITGSPVVPLTLLPTTPEPIVVAPVSPAPVTSVQITFSPLMEALTPMTNTPTPTTSGPTLPVLISKSPTIMGSIMLSPKPATAATSAPITLTQLSPASITQSPLYLAPVTDAPATISKTQPPTTTTPSLSNAPTTPITHTISPTNLNTFSAQQLATSMAPPGCGFMVMIAMLFALILQ